MGSESSTPIGGFRFFKISSNGPADRAGLEPFFDYALELNGMQLNSGTVELRRQFAAAIESLEGKEARLVVFNTRTQDVRDVWVYPQKWQGNGLLGATVRYDLIEYAENQACRVLDVYPNSPAAEAGLVAWKDYILGTFDNFFQNMDDLVDSITAEVGRDVVLLVYNADTEKIREVALRPNYNWGGQGCVGCDIGAGYLHKIRLSKSNPIPSKRAVNPPRNQHDESLAAMNTQQQRQQQQHGLPPSQQQHQENYVTGQAAQATAPLPSHPYPNSAATGYGAPEHVSREASDGPYGSSREQNVATRSDGDVKVSQQDGYQRLHGPADVQSATASTTPEGHTGDIHSLPDGPPRQQDGFHYPPQQQDRGVAPLSPTASSEAYAGSQQQPPLMAPPHHQPAAAPPAAGSPSSTQQHQQPQQYGHVPLSPYNQPYGGFPTSPYDNAPCQQTVTGAARPGVIYHSNIPHH